MKPLFSLLLMSLLYCNFSCNSNPDTKQEAKNTVKIDSQKAGKLDSLKWLYYAYTYTGKALFKTEKGSEIFKPTECEVMISNIKKMKDDSTIYNLKYKKEGYEFSHVYDALNIYGFSVSNDLAIPLTGMLRLDSINNRLYVNKMNNSQDSVFRIFLKTSDTTKLNAWLLTEAKRRNVL